MKLMAAGLLVLALAPTSLPAAAQKIDGAGSALAATVFAAWGPAAKAAAGVELSYQPTGAAEAQGKVIDRTVDFAASDAAIGPARLAATRLLQFPIVLGAVVPVVELPGVAAGKLQLPGELLADIYLGTVTRWNDARIVEANRGIRLPDLAIVPLHRGDGSETTLAFTSYLSAVSREWRTKVGASVRVDWPAGRAANGSDGIAESLRQNRGSIGYVEGSFWHKHDLAFIRLRNKSGRYIAPTVEAYAAAGLAADWPHAQDYAVNLIDLAGEQVWPIVSATFILLPRQPASAERNGDTIRFFEWALDQGSTLANGLDYVSVPSAVQDSIRVGLRTAIRSSAD